MIRRIKQTKKKKIKYRLSNTLKGGKILGIGTTGCVTYPALKCKNNIQLNSKKYVTKLYNPKSDKIINEHVARKGNIYYRYDKKYISEMDKAREIRRRIDGIDKYIIMPIHECDINDSNNSNIEECSSRMSPPPTKMLWIEKADGDLGDFLDIKPKVSKKDLIKAIETLTTGLKLLHSHNITHNDIYEYNILYGYTDKTLWFKLADIELTLFDQDDFKELAADDNKNMDKVISHISNKFKL